MRWASRIACMGEMINAYSILVGKNLKGKDYSEDIDVDGRKV
jgi:hypothetical protein